MPETNFVMSPAEYRAYEILLNSIVKVNLAPQNGGTQDRIAAPVAKIVDCFASEEEAQAFLKRLDGIGGLILGTLSCGSLRVSDTRWLEVSYMIPKPRVIETSTEGSDAVERPFEREEGALVARRGAEEAHREELRTRHAELSRLLAEADAAIVASTATISSLDELLIRVRSLRKRWGTMFPGTCVEKEKEMTQ